jgi:tetratricopeptide (TPR) repeat protein
MFYFYVASVRYVQQKHAEKDLILENYVEIQDAIEFNLVKYADNPKKLDRFNKVNNNLEKNVSKFATCEKLVQLYGPKLEANPDDLKLAKNIVKFFEKRKCTKSDVYFNALEKVHAVEPSPESAFSMGKMAFERKQYDKAKTYLEEATNTLADSLALKKASSYLLLSETYRSLKKFSAARSAALKVLNYNPKEGMAYILIGDLYASSASSCTMQGLRVSYWAAADKYAKAVAISDDPKTKEIAQKKLATIKKSFPEQQDAFMRNLSAGQKITVECWINEETTVRYR